MAKHEVVISGLSGTFPECSNIKIFEDKIFTDENLVTESDPKWKLGPLNIPPYSGKVKDPYLFDQTFFGVHRRLCVVMDAHARLCIEKTYEALFDAGVNYQDVYGGNVAVIMTTMTSESEYGTVTASKNSGHAMLGQSRSMQANRISYFFNFKGPSLSMESSWIGPTQGLQIAADLVAKGHVQMAVVGASSLSIHPEVAVHYDCLKKLSADGKTRSFSADAGGYNRSEGVIVFIIQRAQDAFRSYASIVKVRCSTEMDHTNVFADPCGFKNFLKDFYSDVHISSSEIGYIEGDGTASLALDAMELNGVSDVLCAGRDKPLLVGSCKSKLGHGESCSAFNSIVNALIAFKTGHIPPCLHFTEPNPDVPALLDGRMQVVTKKTPLEGDYIGVTAIGVCSIFSHVLLKKNSYSRPIKDESYFPPDGIPRLFLLSGRDEDQMKEILQKIENRPIDENYYALNHMVFRRNLPKHLYRGYSLVGEDKKQSKVVHNPGGGQQPVWFIFSGMGSQWNEMGAGVMKIPTIRRAIEKCHKVLEPKGIDLMTIVTTTDPTIYDNILHAFVGIAAIQIGLVDLLEELGVKADGFVGHSVGELGCSYADKCLTAEQVILAAYARGKASNEAQLIKGMMAAVGKGYAAIKNELPDGVEVACHNSRTSCTLSGPEEIMKKYVDELKAKGVFARLVNVANIAYHSKNIAPAAPYLLKYLKEIIPEPKMRSSKWVSSSIPEINWETDMARFCSAEYHTNNLLSYVLFEEATAHVPKNAICIEIAPHGLLQAIIKKSLATCTHVPLTNRNMKKGISFLIEALGTLFTNEVLIDLTKLYPPVQFPVPRETDFLNVVTWDHNEVWIPLSLQYDVAPKVSETCWKGLVLTSNEENVVDFPRNHTIRGRAFYSKAKLLDRMMGYFKHRAEITTTNFKCYVFSNLIFHNNLAFNIKEDALLHVLFQKGTGFFESVFKSETITTGQLTHTTTPLPEPILNSSYAENQGKQIFINSDQIYQYFETNDCIFNGPFRNIISINIFEKGFAGKVKYTQNSEFYLDAIIKLMMLYSSVQKDTLMDLDSIFQLLYDPTVLPEHDKEVDVFYDETFGCLVAEGIRILLFKAKPLSLEMADQLDMKKLLFVPYSKIDPQFQFDFAELCMQFFRENSTDDKITLQFIVDERSNISKHIAKKISVRDQLSNYKINLFPRHTVTEMSLTKFACDVYLIIAENGLHGEINKLLTSNKVFYFIHTGKPSDLEKTFSLERLSPIIEQEISGHNVVLYKQRMAALSNFVFAQISNENFSQEVASIKSSGPNETLVLVLSYRLLSEVISTMLSCFNKSMHNKRFIFLDETSPDFDPNNDFYRTQLAKDLKINIAFKGEWGSLKHTNFQVKEESREELNLHAFTNYIRCKTVDLKVISLNLKSLVFPKKYKKFSVIEFSGLIGDEPIFGLGRLTEDNYLEVDPHLCWQNPKNWTMEEMATVPLYYCMAYDLLYVKGKFTNRIPTSVFIHAGHTPLAQAIITVALSASIKVFTTCFTPQQKLFISQTFPQMSGENIYIVSENRYSFVNEILSSSDGDGPKVVIDSLEDNELRNQTLQCTGDMGIYYLLTNNDMDVEHTFGMKIFLREIAVTGYNPELIFDLKEEEKQTLCGLLDTGIKTNVVRPLTTHSVTENISNAQATEAVISESQEEFPRKVIVPIKKLQKPSFQAAKVKDVLHKKNYMIVGTYNNLWFDLLKWLIGKGADSVHVVLNQDDIPQYLKKRFGNFIAKNKFISVLFSETENLNTAQNCTQFIKAFQNGSTIDTVFYLKPGFEKQMANIDYALRMNSKTSSLVGIGFQACRIMEKRRNDGFKGVSFTLMKNSIRNSMVLNALDNWYHNCDENYDVILVDKAKPKELKEIEKYADILPTRGLELVDIIRNISDQPGFIEMPTKSPRKVHAPDVNSVFLFPGMKLAQLEKFTKKIMYPTFVATYPLVIKSLEDLAKPFSELMVKMFDYHMFTLIAEGWSGPLVLTIAKELEERGKSSAVILMEGSPETVKNWNAHLDRSNSVISKYLPSIKKGKKITISDLRSWSTKITKTILREEDCGDSTQDEIQMGYEALLNRLYVVQNFSCANRTLASTVHLFTGSDAEFGIADLSEMCPSFYHHVMSSSNILLEDPKLINDVNNLTLLEYKTRAKKQLVKDMATLELIGEVNSMYSSDGYDMVAVKS